MLLLIPLWLPYVVSRQLQKIEEGSIWEWTMRLLLTLHGKFPVTCTLSGRVRFTLLDVGEERRENGLGDWLTCACHSSQCACEHERARYKNLTHTMYSKPRAV